MYYQPAHTTLGEKIITVIGFLLLSSTAVAAVMVATHLVGIA